MKYRSFHAETRVPFMQFLGSDGYPSCDKLNLILHHWIYHSDSGFADQAWAMISVSSAMKINDRNLPSALPTP